MYRGEAASDYLSAQDRYGLTLADISFESALSALIIRKVSVDDTGRTQYPDAEHDRIYCRGAVVDIGIGESAWLELTRSEFDKVLVGDALGELKVVQLHTRAKRGYRVRLMIPYALEDPVAEQYDPRNMEATNRAATARSSWWSATGERWNWIANSRPQPGDWTADQGYIGSRGPRPSGNQPRSGFRWGR